MLLYPTEIQESKSDSTLNYFLSTLVLTLGYGLAFYLVQTFLYQIGAVSFTPNAATLNRWDAGIYYDLAQHGYYYTGNKPDDTAVFVLFPWIWKILHVGYGGMAIANFILFSFSFSIVCSIYRISIAERLLWLTTPSLYFMMVPYSEATFALMIAFSFYGIVKQNRWIIWSSLFLVCLCRATAVFLLPSLLAMELLSNQRKDIGKALFHYLSYYALPVIAGTLFFILLQYYYTGQWMIYYKGQVENLGHKFAIPTLPFSDFYGGNKMLWLNALAMCVCVIALALLILKIIKWLFKGEQDSNKLWLLTLAYLPIVMFVMVFINPTWGSNTTNLLGFHRYTFCSPFIFVFLYNLVNKPTGYRPKTLLLIFIICNVVWLFFNSYVHIRFLLFYNFNTLIVLAYILYSKKKSPLLSMALCAFNFLIQAWLFQQYLSGWFTE